MTFNDILKAVADKDGVIHDKPVIFRDDKGGWANLSVKSVGPNIEISVDPASPFQDE